MHTRQDASAPEGTLRQALAWVINERIFDNLVLHGNTKWLPVDLVVLALFWVWSDQPTLTAAFTQAQRWAAALFTRVAIHSYQGLTGALVTWTSQLLPLLWQRCQHCLEQCGQKHWRRRPLAGPGRRRAPASARHAHAPNEQAFCAPASYGHSRTAKYRKKKRERASSQACRRTGQAADLDDLVVAHGPASAVELEERPLVFQ